MNRYREPDSRSEIVWYSTQPKVMHYRTLQSFKLHTFYWNFFKDMQSFSKHRTKTKFVIIIIMFLFFYYCNVSSLTFVFKSLPTENQIPSLFPRRSPPFQLLLYLDGFFSAGVFFIRLSDKLKCIPGVSFLHHKINCYLKFQHLVVFLQRWNHLFCQHLKTTAVIRLWQCAFTSCSFVWYPLRLNKYINNTWLQ